MTTIKTYEDVHVLGIEASGHATGNQDVCSAVSALMLSFKAYLEAYGEPNTVEQGDAHMLIVCQVNEYTLPVYKMLVCGLEAMQESYPEFLLVLEGHLEL